MNSSSFRRLAKDHAALRNAELPPYYLFGPNTSLSNALDDLTQLTIFLTGPHGTPYSDGLWKLYLKIPQDYPKNPPKAYFRTKIWHPNVEESDGSVCLDTLKRDWEPKLTLRDILITISCLLINPNPDSALNAGAGKLLQEDWDEYSQHAKLMTSIHAGIPSNMKKVVEQARRRGEESRADCSEQDTESEDEEENTKENDSSLSPSPVDPSPPPNIRRPTVLGKRPLGELPTPEDSPSDDEADNTLSCSARNIVANTPNLSNSMNNLSFSSAPPLVTCNFDSSNSSSRPPKLGERIRGTNFANSFPSTSRQFLSESFIRIASHEETQMQPKAKRVCSEEGKENEGENSQAHISILPKPVPLVGLGLKTGSASAPTSRKPSATSANISKPKPRIGLRRL